MAKEYSFKENLTGMKKCPRCGRREIPLSEDSCGECSGEYKSEVRYINKKIQPEIKNLYPLDEEKADALKMTAAENIQKLVNGKGEAITLEEGRIAKIETIFSLRHLTGKNRLLIGTSAGFFEKKKIKNAQLLCTTATIFRTREREEGQYNEAFRTLRYFFPELLNKILKKNKPVPKNFSQYIISGVKSFINIGDVSADDGWKQSIGDYIAMEIYKEVISIYDKYLESVWQIIGILHREGRNEEAFLYFQNQKNNLIDIPEDVIAAITGMLISLEQKKEARSFINSALSAFAINEKGGSNIMLGLLLLDEIFYLKREKIEDYINLIRETELLLVDGEIDPAALSERLAENVIYRVACFFNEGDLKEALAWINIIISVCPDNQEFLDIKRDIEKDLKEGNTWESIKSESDFFRYLYRRLAHRFHPDLSKNDEERIEKTKIMSEINRAMSDNDLQRLKKLAQEHASDWVKYFKY